MTADYLFLDNNYSLLKYIIIINNNIDIIWHVSIFFFLYFIINCII